MEGIQSKIRFCNVDVLKMLGCIVQAHTQHFRSDFDIDREMLCDAAEKERQQDRTFVWLCRTAGTCLLRERDVFLRGTREHNNTFRFYMEQTQDTVLAYVAEIMYFNHGIIWGNVSALDYGEYYSHVVSKSVAVGSLILRYKGGSRTEGADTVIDGRADREYGDFTGCEYQPVSIMELREALWDERYYRRQFKEGDMEEYLERLKEAEEYAGRQCKG